MPVSAAERDARKLRAGSPEAQAVCASYLYAQTSQEHYPQFHAQLDDTVSFQVYNHEASGALSAQAVQETAGRVLMCKGQIVNALYYSTSCGFSQSGQYLRGG